MGVSFGALTRLAALAALALTLGCGAAPPEVDPPQRLPPLPPPPTDWQTTALADHPLVGQIWSTADAAFVDPATLRARVALTPGLVLIGEKHDNPDHHRLQAWLLDPLAARGRPIVFEMLDLEDADAIAAAETPDALAAAVEWDRTGWPAFALYRPLFEALYTHRAPVRPGHPARAEVRAAMTTPLDAHPPALGLTRTLDPADTAALRDEIEASHCGHATPTLVDGMVRAQRFKDAVMADALRAAAGEGNGALVAGNGHVRAQGVPLFLDRPATSIGIVEVRADRQSVDAATAAEVTGGRFDFVWFTPRVDTRDPCEVFREQLERMRRLPPAPQPATQPATQPASKSSNTPT